MNILLSAFAFSPIWGSEPGVGWNWALELAKTHQVTVVTHGYFRKHVEQADEALNGSRLEVVYVDVAPVWGEFHEQLLNSQLYYLRWQWHLLKVARALSLRQKFDLVHHITWGTFRYPSFLGWLGLPFVFGPLGGGEVAPMRLYQGLPAKVLVKEALRNVIVASARFDPILRACLGKCTVILCRTPQTLAALPAASRGRAWVAHEIGAPTASPPPPREARAGSTTRLLFAGRLLGWKGVHLALRAVALSRQRGMDVELTIVGSGPLRSYLVNLGSQLAIGNSIRFVAQVPRDQMLKMYHDADAFLFPSLHDSGGTVVLEALSRGLPVICLDLGGPACFVQPGTGSVISTGQKSTEDIVRMLADAIEDYSHAADAQRIRRVSDAIDHANAMTWEKQVGRVYQRLASLSMGVQG